MHTVERKTNFLPRSLSHCWPNRQLRVRQRRNGARWGFLSHATVKGLNSGRPVKCYEVFQALALTTWSDTSGRMSKEVLPYSTRGLSFNALSPVNVLLTLVVANCSYSYNNQQFKCWQKFQSDRLGRCTSSARVVCIKHTPAKKRSWASTVKVGPLFVLL